MLARLTLVRRTTIRDVTIDAGPAAIGLDVSGVDGYAAYKQHGITRHSIGGGGTIEDITIRGGDTSLKISSSQWALRGLNLSGAASQGMLCETNTMIQLVDSEISAVPVAVTLAAGSSYVFLDMWFSNIGNGTAIRSGGRALYLENATADNSVRSLVDDGPAALDPAKAFWQGAAYLGGVKDARSSGTVAASRLPRLLQSRPTFEKAGGADPANVLAFGAKGDGIHDDTAAFVKAIAASEVVFVPWGLYKITETLVLTSKSKIVGEGLAHIWLGNNSAGFNNPQKPKALILAPDDADAEVWLADLLVTCGKGNAGAVSIHWMSGHGGIWDVHLPFYMSSQAFLLHLDRNGGGTFSNMWLWGGDHDVNTNQAADTWPSFPAADLPCTVVAGKGRQCCCSAWNNSYGFLATSTGRAYFLGVASEHDVEIAWSVKSASNIVMIGTPQTEHTPLALSVQDSDSIEIFGVLATAMHPDFYAPGPWPRSRRQGLPALIALSNNTRTRLVAPNVCSSSMIVNSTDASMRVAEGGVGFRSAIIAWDTSGNSTLASIKRA